MLRQSHQPPMIEAHRGNSAQAPEISLAAFRRAVELGVPWIELDIHPTCDGELVVIHDDPVEARRLTAAGVEKICSNRPGEIMMAVSQPA
jgi:glycerophosphoryl diester phosphodiesterase